VAQPIRSDLASQRREYENPPLREAELAENPFDQFQSWFTSVLEANLLEPNAMVLATVDPQGRPTQRTVLLKSVDPQGFVFFTNYLSRKATHLRQNQYLSLHFLWLSLQRQVEVSGRAELVTTADSADYFATRPRGSQLGAWVSEQSQLISSRQVLESKLAEFSKRFEGMEIPLPPHWGGFRVIPDRFEFWQGQANRLHDRIQYTRSTDDSWIIQRLSP
jgi:pyridoxamine 5'-phosphate oxidase